MKQTTIEILRQARDSRGVVFEPLDAAQLELQRNVHVVLTRPGGIRGNHRHLQTTEILTAVGPALVRVREGGIVREILVPSEATYRFTIPPGIAHAVLNTGTSTGLIISFSTQPHDPGKGDTVADRLIEPSWLEDPGEKGDDGKAE
jgi:dTDP-4-dehydrorhamnose 3,5-epimerase-like enzyme